MFYCGHCHKIIDTRDINQFRFSDKHNNNHTICDTCVDIINSKLTVQVLLCKA